MSDPKQYPDPPKFSRSGNSNPLGKNTAEIRVLVPEELQLNLQALAVLRNTNVSEYVRDVLMAHVYGHLGLARLKTTGKNMEE